MDLSALGNTLPPGLADAEREMGDKFRAAALSITNLYKSSLGYTKQAYHAGYSACLQDVLSTVQSAIAGGQDAEQTLSRLMDWAEARETAMAAFAAEDTEDLVPPPRPAQLRQALSTLHAPQPLPGRPSSAPPTDKSHSPLLSAYTQDDPLVSQMANDPTHIPAHPGASRPNSRTEPVSPNPTHPGPGQSYMTPSSIESTPAGPSTSRMPHPHPHLPGPSHSHAQSHNPTSLPTLLQRDLKSLGKRYSPLKAQGHARSAIGPSASLSSTGLPSSAFAPSLPHLHAHTANHLAVPSFASALAGSTSDLAVPLATGSKRPISLALAGGDAMDVEDSGAMGAGAVGAAGAQSREREGAKRKKSRREKEKEREREEEEKREGAGSLPGPGGGGQGRRGGGGKRHGGALA